MSPPRIPTPSDFAPLHTTLTFDLLFPSPPESTTTILILLHGLGDTHTPFANFARSMQLPGVLSIAVRGVSQLPSFLADPDGSITGEDNNSGSSGRGHWHYGSDIQLNTSTGELDPDPGFASARDLILGKLVGETLVGKLGWDGSDIMILGFGQGGSVALGLAAVVGRWGVGGVVRRVSGPHSQSGIKQIGDGKDGGDVVGEERISDKPENRRLKGVISLGGPLLESFLVSPDTRGTNTGAGTRKKNRTPVLLVGGSSGSGLTGEGVGEIRDEFEGVEVVRWKRYGDGMPRDREEMLGLMKFFAARLKEGMVV